MLTKGDKPRALKRLELAELEEMALVPLGMPMLAGPGAISLVIVLMQTTAWPIVIASITATIAICAAIFSQASKIYKVLGDSGARALTRVMGFLTSALAVQYILTGIQSWAGTWL
jgi:multiple antibiotic resistance protein